MRILPYYISKEKTSKLLLDFFLRPR